MPRVNLDVLNKLISRYRRISQKTQTLEEDMFDSIHKDMEKLYSLLEKKVHDMQTARCVVKTEKDKEYFPEYSSILQKLENRMDVVYVLVGFVENSQMVSELIEMYFSIGKLGVSGEELCVHAEGILQRIFEIGLLLINFKNIWIKMLNRTFPRRACTIRNITDESVEKKRDKNTKMNMKVEKIAGLAREFLMRQTRLQNKRVCVLAFFLALTLVPAESIIDMLKKTRTAHTNIFYVILYLFSCGIQNNNTTVFRTLFENQTINPDMILMEWISVPKEVIDLECLYIREKIDTIDFIKNEISNHCDISHFVPIFKTHKHKCIELIEKCFDVLCIQYVRTKTPDIIDLIVCSYSHENAENTVFLVKKAMKYGIPFDSTLVSLIVTHRISHGELPVLLAQHVQSITLKYIECCCISQSVVLNMRPDTFVSVSKSRYFSVLLKRKQTLNSLLLRFGEIEWLDVWIRIFPDFENKKKASKKNKKDEKDEEVRRKIYEEFIYNLGSGYFFQISKKIIDIYDLDVVKNRVKQCFVSIKTKKMLASIRKNKKICYKLFALLDFEEDLEYIYEYMWFLNKQYFISEVLFRRLSVYTYVWIEKIVKQLGRLNSLVRDMFLQYLLENTHIFENSFLVDILKSQLNFSCLADPVVIESPYMNTAAMKNLIQSFDKERLYFLLSNLKLKNGLCFGKNSYMEFGLTNSSTFSVIISIENTNCGFSPIFYIYTDEKMVCFFEHNKQYGYFVENISCNTYCDKQKHFQTVTENVFGRKAYSFLNKKINSLLRITIQYKKKRLKIRGDIDFEFAIDFSRKDKSFAITGFVGILETILASEDQIVPERLFTKYNTEPEPETIEEKLVYNANVIHDELYIYQHYIKDLINRHLYKNIFGLYISKKPFFLSDKKTPSIMKNVFYYQYKTLLQKFMEKKEQAEQKNAVYDNYKKDSLATK